MIVYLPSRKRVKSPIPTSMWGNSRGHSEMIWNPLKLLKSPNVAPGAVGINKKEFDEEYLEETKVGRLIKEEMEQEENDIRT